MKYLNERGLVAEVVVEDVQALIADEGRQAAEDCKVEGTDFDVIRSIMTP